MPSPSLLDYLYEEDITGVDPANKVEDEFHTVTVASEPGAYSIIVPLYGPYFRESMVIVHVSTGVELIPGIDWQPGHVFDSASHETEWVHGGIYGSILIMNRNLTGQFRLQEYQTLGGAWLWTNPAILQVLSNRIVDPRSKTFEQVSGIPSAFPPLDHDQPIDDVTGFIDVITQLAAISQAVEDRTETWLNNPPVLMSQYYMKTETEALIDAKLDARIAPLETQLTQLANSVIAGMNDRYTKAESDARYVRL